MSQESVIGKLAQIYPQLYLNPDVNGLEQYRSVVLRGALPQTQDLGQYYMDPRDKLETVNTPAGPVQVLTLFHRADFERFIRNMMAAKDGPEKKVPASQGASMLIAINWPRIHAHMEQYLTLQRAAGNPDPDVRAEFSRFKSDRRNYQDTLVVLSRGPYSNVPAAAVGKTEAEWLEQSGSIRMYHELTHVICRAQYPDRIHPIWDELVADAVGLYGTYQHLDPEMEKRFLGIAGSQYTKGRLENYTDHPSALAPHISRILDRLAQLALDTAPSDPFALIPLFQSHQQELAAVLS
jgi:hypothetical protein